MRIKEGVFCTLYYQLHCSLLKYAHLFTFHSCQFQSADSNLTRRVEDLLNNPTNSSGKFICCLTA